MYFIIKKVLQIELIQFYILYEPQNYVYTM